MFLKQTYVTILLLTTFFLVNCCTNVSCKIVEIDLSDDLPKNIMVGTILNDKNHLKPILDICSILIERSYNIILVSPDKFTLSSEYPAVKHISLTDGINDSKNDISLRKYSNSFKVYEEASKQYNVDLFLCDVMANDACLDVAHLLNKPLVGYGSFLLELQLKYKYDDDLSKKLKDSLFLANTFYGFELPQSLPPNVLEIGPVLSDEYSPLTRKLSSFINSHKRILYVNLDIRGLTTENNDILLKSFFEAINEKIVDGVIWSLPKTSFNNLSSTIKLSDGTLIHTLSILNNNNPDIHVTGFTPQFAILKHNNTKLFLSNGDSVSSYESLYTATPMLLIPHDNHSGNVERLNNFGIGAILSQHQLNVENILEKMDTIMKDDQVTKNVKKFENLTKLNSKRKYKAADLIEYILYTSGENINEKSCNELKELITADVQIGFNRKQLYDTYGNFILGIGLVLLGGVTFIIVRVFRLLIRLKIISFGWDIKKD